MADEYYEQLRGPRHKILNCKSGNPVVGKMVMLQYVTCQSTRVNFVWFFRCQNSDKPLDIKVYGIHCKWHQIEN